MKERKKFILIIFFLIAVITTGVIGYMLLLDLNFINALYMTVITISTVGYGEVGVMNDSAKIFSIFIIFSGLSVVGYGFTNIVSLFFEGEFKDAWRKKRMDKKIQGLKNHYIICGAGDIGRTVVKCFQESNIEFVVIEENSNRVNDLIDSDILTVLGDATHESTLEKAGINQAKGIICTLNSDSENVFTVLTARQMKNDIYIVSKAIEQSSHGKLLKAGANKTISPNEIGGQRIAAHIIRPTVISFLDIITRAGEVTLDLEEIIISEGSDLVGKKLYEAKIPEQTGLIVLALKRKDDKNVIFNPSSNEIINFGDTMIVLGTAEQTTFLEKIVNTAFS